MTMKQIKRLGLFMGCACLILSATNIKAQAPDTSTTEKLLHYIMKPLDKSQIPTGFLQEYGCPMLPMATFNGTLSDSNKIGMDLWRTLYFQLQTGYCGSGTNPLPNIKAVNAAIKQFGSDTTPTPIPLLLGQYNTVKTNAFANHLLSYNRSTNQVSDVAGRSQSPYQLNNLFAACPTFTYSKTGMETFICKSSLIWNNTGKTISQLQINFDNGQGFQTIVLGYPFSVRFITTGQKKWTIKAVLSDGTQLQCYSNYYVVKAAPISRIGLFSYSPDPYSGEITYPYWGYIYQHDAVSNGYYGAQVTINYSKNNYTGTLRKPLIVVEGYDVSHKAPSLQPDYTVTDFIAGINAPFPLYNFSQQLDDVAGYDLVFVNFYDGAADIRGNAAVVEEVIRRVNSHKVIDNRPAVPIVQQNVVMGLSMGGLCARYGLAKMTKNNENTQTHLLITHDSPHHGANVPLGLQYLIQMMGGFQLFGYNVYDVYPQYDDVLNLLKAKGTQQLLIYRSKDANHYEANTFLDGDYRSTITFKSTDPKPAYHFIATSLGSECGHPLTDPGYTYINTGAGISAGVKINLLFFSIPITSYYLDAQTEAYALPNTGSTAKIARLYTRNQLQLFGFINVFKQLYDNTAYAPGNHLAIDGVPGSTSPLLQADALAQISSLPAFDVSLNVEFPLYGLLSGYVNTYAYNTGVSPKFTFVSTASALDAGPVSTPIFSEKYVNGVNRVYPSTSETFIAQETNNTAGTTNNTHIRFTARNSQWLFNQMEGKPNLLNCSSECSNPYYIDGPDLVCTNGDYSIPGLPIGASVIWSVSSSAASLSCSTCNVTTLTSVNNGKVTLSAILQNACGGVTTLTKDIYLGSPILISAGYTNTYNSNNYDLATSPIANPVCNGYNSFTNMGIEGATSAKWSKVSLSSGVMEFNTNDSYLNLLLFSQGQTAVFRLTAKNACGSMPAYDFKWQASPCSGGCKNYSLSPNPSPHILNIMIPPSLPPCAVSGSLMSTDSLLIKELNLFDNKGSLRKTVNVGGSTQGSINLDGLNSGTYIVEIKSTKNYTERQVFIKQ